MKSDLLMNKPLVSCIIPTLNRPALLKQTLTRLFETTRGIEIEAVVVADECWAALHICDEINDMAGKWFARMNFSTKRRGAVACWNIGLEMASADFFFHQGDDLDYSDGWLDKALEAHRTKLNGYGMVGVNDSMHNGNVMATHVLFDRQFCKDVFGGVMAPPIIKYYGVDVILNELAKEAGKFYWCEQAVVRHIHPANGGREVDDTDRSHQDAWTDDQNALDAWRARGRKIEWGAVI